LIRLLNVYFPARTFFLGLSEACLVALAFVAATIVRLGPNDATLVLGYEQGAIKIFVVSAAIMGCMYYFDLYDSSILNNRREVLTRLITVLGTVSVLLALLYFMFPALELGRGISLIGFLLVAAILLLWRRLFFLVNSQVQFADRALILGDGPLAACLLREVESRPELGLRIVGQVRAGVDGNAETTCKQDEANGGPYALAASGELSNAVKFHRANRIIVAMGDRRGKLPVEPLLSLKSRGVLIQDGTEMYEEITGKVHLESLRLGWLLYSPSLPISALSSILRRVFWFVLSVTAIAVTAPLMGLIALAIRLDSAGPVIYRQKRVGQDGRTFTLYKFRTMVPSTSRDEDLRPAETTDSRFTRVGRWLRLTRLDELPQLVNILLGDMNLVGPRPFVPQQEQECLDRIPYYRQRWVVKPGATGWAQVNRGYCATIEDNADKLAYDLYYIKNVSLGLDMLILFKTMKILLLSRGSR
jgi:sugar transferase (PEP-CTERM system associated)